MLIIILVDLISFQLGYNINSNIPGLSLGNVHNQNVVIVFFFVFLNKVLSGNFMKNVNILIVVILLFFSSINLFSQINTEVFRKEFSKDGIFHKINVDIGITKGNTEYTTVRPSYRIDWLKDKFHNFGIISYAYAEDAVKKRENRGFIHLRSSYQIFDYLYGELFLQKEFNEFILLKDRNLFGITSRIQIINEIIQIDSTEKLEIYTFLGLGAMIENEELKTKPRKETTVGRLTSYFSLGVNISPNLLIKSITYYQPRFSDDKDYRLLNESSLNIKINQNLTFRTSLRLRYDSDPPEKVKPRDLNLLNGIQIDF